MKQVLGLLVVFALLASLAIAAAAGKTYQVTGPVLDVTPTTIVVQKGNDKWELQRDASTQVTGDLKVGARVTAEYRMIATTVAVKEGATAEKGKTKKK